MGELRRGYPSLISYLRNEDEAGRLEPMAINKLTVALAATAAFAVGFAGGRQALNVGEELAGGVYIASCSRPAALILVGSRGTTRVITSESGVSIEVVFDTVKKLEQEGKLTTLHAPCPPPAAHVQL